MNEQKEQKQIQISYSLTSSWEQREKYDMMEARAAQITQLKRHPFSTGFHDIVQGIRLIFIGLYKMLKYGWPQMLGWIIVLGILVFALYAAGLIGVLLGLPSILQLVLFLVFFGAFYVLFIYILSLLKKR